MDLAGVLIDGETVAYYAKGDPIFRHCRRRCPRTGRLEFFAFDLLVEDGEDIAKRPLFERKERLQALLDDLPKNSLSITGPHRRTG